jgi:antiviral helicase SKI2
MDLELSEAVQKLHITDKTPNIDDILFRQAPIKHAQQSPKELKAKLEKKYLSPSTQFSTEWLDKLQQ